jgi:hypothetical protein
VQYIGSQEVINKQVEVAQPLLTGEQIEQINFTLIEALHTNKQDALHIIRTAMYNRNRIDPIC